MTQRNPDVGSPYQDGLGIADNARACSGIAVMADGNVALQPGQFIFIKCVCHKAHIRMDIDLVSFSCSYTCAFLSPVLKSIQSKKSYSGYISSGGVNTEYAAAFVQIVHQIPYGLYGFC
jgi:hypothetical protein